MPLTNLKSNPKKSRKRVGRGNASGHGTFSCRGMKGQSARSGGRRRPGFEGGQTPYLRRIPKLKGFKNPNRVDYQAINIGQLNIFEDNAKITLKELLDKNLVSKKTLPVKLLAGKGELEKTLTIVVEKASQAAIKAVEAKKGTVELLEIAKPKKSKKEEAPKEKEEASN